MMMATTPPGRRPVKTEPGARAFDPGGPGFVADPYPRLNALREAGFNALSMPVDVPPEVLEDAIDNYRFWLVPHLPPLADTNPDRPATSLTV